MTKLDELPTISAAYGSVRIQGLEARLRLACELLDRLADVNPADAAEIDAFLAKLRVEGLIN